MPNVIVVSANHDPVTQALSTYATTIAAHPLQNGSIKHVYDKTAPDIQNIISAANGDSIFFFLHGRNQPPGVVDGNGSPVIDQTNVILLKSRTVCGTCYFLDDLATLAVAHGATIVGYSGKMWVPLDPQYLQEMEDAALAPHRSLIAGQTASNAAQVAGKEYTQTADRWFKMQTLSGLFHSAVAESNALAIGSRP